MNEIVKSNMTVAAGRTVNLIAAEINSIKEQTRKMVLYNSIEIGRRLVEAKQLINHGEWGEWLEKSVDYSQSTANNLMRIFNEYGSEQLTLLDNNAKSQALGNLSYTQAIAMLGIPSEERENFIKEQDINNLSTRELQKAIKEREQALKEKEEAEKKLKETEKISSSNLDKAEKLKKELEKVKEKNKEDLLNREVEITNFKLHIEDIKHKLAEAESNGDSEEAERLETALQENETALLEANKRIDELEKQLSERPIEVSNAVIERVPDEVVKELQELREKVNNGAGNDKARLKFSLQFDGLVKNFKELLETLEEVQSDEIKDKYKTAVRGLIEKMTEHL